MSVVLPSGPSASMLCIDLHQWVDRRQSLSGAWSASTSLFRSSTAFSVPSDLTSLWAMYVLHWRAILSTSILEYPYVKFHTAFTGLHRRSIPVARPNRSEGAESRPGRASSRRLEFHLICVLSVQHNKWATHDDVRNELGSRVARSSGASSVRGCSDVPREPAVLPLLRCCWYVI